MIKDQDQDKYIEAIKAEVLKIEHVTDAVVKIDKGELFVVAETFLANDDGSKVERASVCATADIGSAREQKIVVWAKILCLKFDKAIAEKYQGYTRYATPEEIAKYKLAKGQA